MSAETVAKMTATDVREALHRRYNKPSQGRDGEQYVCIEEARSGAGFQGNAGQCDFLAINTWQSRGMELLGHEVKVSMSDWKAELAQQEKAERFARYCRRWYVAVPSVLAAKIKDEVPPAWGLLSVSEQGRCTELRPAPARDPEPVPPWWWVGWLAQIDRQHKRSNARTVEQRLAAEREKLTEQVEADIERRRRYADEGVKTLRENVKAFKDATGIDLQHAWKHDFNRLGEVWALVRSGFDVTHLIKSLRGAADALDAMTAPPDPL